MLPANPEAQEQLPMFPSSMHQLRFLLWAVGYCPGMPGDFTLPACLLKLQCTLIWIPCALFKKEPCKCEHLNENSSCKGGKFTWFWHLQRCDPRVSVLRDLGRLLPALQLLTDHCSCRLLDTDLCWFHDVLKCDSLHALIIIKNSPWFRMLFISQCKVF